MPDFSERFLLSATFVLAFAVITLGAYVRLSNAGLGCPDWPGCYGHWTVPAHLATTAEGYARARIEMTHRYAAALLGLAITVLAWKAWRGGRARAPALGLVVLVGLQAALGMWTVTLKLLPLVVMAHLLGGMSLLALLGWWWMTSERASPHARKSTALRPVSLGALLLVVGQIGLGGWTSANYAALACPDLPTCQGQWWPAADFRQAFSLPAADAGNYEGGAHEGPARIAIHLAHRVGALVVIAAVLFLAFAFARSGYRGTAAVLVAALGLQAAVGITNVAFGLPLGMAVFHTAGAALLLLATLAALRRAFSP